MLCELRIENLLLIERAELRLGEGLNVITGETGAGKTILAHALDLVLGGKPRDGLIRPGAEEAWVEASFEMPGELAEDGDEQLAAILERLPAGAEELTLGRRVSANGRTSAYIGGRSASAADLALLGSRLVAFYGQHQHRKLTIASAQAEILDSAGGEEAHGAARRYRAANAEVGSLERELSELRSEEGSRQRDLDLIRFELSEIEEAAPSVEEVEALEAERQRLRNVEGIRESAQRALQLLDGDEPDSAGATALAGEASAVAGEARGADGDLDRIADRVSASAIELEESARELRRHLDGLEADPERLSQVEERLDELGRLQRKHGGTIISVLEHAERCRQEIERLEHGESRLAGIESDLERARGERSGAAAELTDARQGAKRELEDRIATQLGELAMEGASFEVDLQPYAEGYGPSGAERIEFLLAPNSGIAPARLRDAASGGELSRVMLALGVVAGAAGPASIVFDEIDAGVGGRTANAVGEKLRRLGESGQVVAITHLPQVAAQASVHLRVVKDEGADPARADVEPLRGDAVIEEITRMLGADSDDQTAVSHARELVAASNSS